MIDPATALGVMLIQRMAGAPFFAAARYGKTRYTSIRRTIPMPRRPELPGPGPGLPAATRRSA